MIQHHVSIATITWARNEAEEKLLREALQQLAMLQIPAYITDGGSSPLFLDFLRSIPHFTILQAEAKGVWAQAKNSLLAAYEAGTHHILYTEPDKLDFFRHYLPGMLGQLPDKEQVGILLAARTDAAFATFPPFQKMTETTINNCCREIIGKNMEYTYGPFIMKRELVPYLKLIQEDVGWGWRPYTFGLAYRLGYTLEAFAGHFSCPPEQRADNPGERIYRMRQLTQNIQGLVLSTSIKFN